MSKRLSGKVALVTGASSGLGRHFAQVLAGEGATVMACARRLGPLEQLAGELADEGNRCHAVQMDATDPASIADAFARVREVVGRGPDVVVNNAGAAQTKAAIDLTEDDWTGIIDLNLNGVFRVAQVAAREMIADGRPGAIVNIASILGLRVASSVASYAASKAAVIQLSKALALEWAKHGIRVNVLAPGYVDTELNHDFFQSTAGQKLIQKIPNRRLGEMRELAEPLLLLCADGSSNMTGSVVVVDGGHSINSL